MYLADHDSVPLDIVGGKGCHLFEKKGAKLLDFIGGWCVGTVGWQDAEMEKAITAQAKKGFYVPPLLRSPEQEAFAKTLVSHAPGRLRRAFRCTSGSEAVEFAIKCARAATGKQAIVSIDGVYHGHTYGAASLGNACDKMQPCAPGFIKLPLPRTPEMAERVVEEFERILIQRDDVAAFMSEPVWTNAGTFIPPAWFYPRIQELCRRHGALLVMDEVAAGMGRCGALFASELWGIEPDIVCMGKAIGGGYATLGATLVTEDVFRKSRGIPEYSTFGWLQQDLAAAAKNFELVIERNLVDNARAMGELIMEELQPIRQAKKVKDVRGIGLVFSVEFHLPIAPAIVWSCYRSGLLVALADAKTLFCSPPLALTEKLAREGARTIRKACGVS